MPHDGHISAPLIAPFGLCFAAGCSGSGALTGDFRNRASHGIAPRFSVGITSTVTRTRQQATKLERQPDGTYKDMPVPGQLSTGYGVGGTEPLSMQQAWTANLAQFEHARRTFDAYIALLAEGVAAMPRGSGALP